MPTEKRQRQKAGRQARLEAERKQQKRKKQIRRTITLVVAAAVVVGVAVWLSSGSGKKTNAASTTTTTTAPTAAAQTAANKASAAAGCPSDPTAKLTKPTWSTPPAMTVDPSKTYTATIKTDVGTIVATLNAKTAPTAVNDFVFLADQKYYDCITFWRSIPGFMIQGGDATGTGTGAVGYTVAGEVPATAASGQPQYPIGSLAMAKTGQAANGTSSNQFFIVSGSQGESLPPQYALFGQVTSGQDVVNKIAADGNSDPSANGSPPNVTHRMLSVTIAVS